MRQILSWTNSNATLVYFTERIVSIIYFNRAVVLKEEKKTGNSQLSNWTYYRV